MARTFTKLLVALGFGLFSQPSFAADLLVDSNGILTGANGVNVGGTYYDVTFVDGLCSTNFSGCNQSSDFSFTTLADATTAAQALLDQVFINAFDTTPTLIFGCGGTFCGALVPYGTPVFLGNGVYDVPYAEAVNFTSVSDSISSNVVISSYNTATAIDANRFVWAKFALSDYTPPVPEPATWVMMLLGFGGIGMAMRRLRSGPHRSVSPSTT